MNAEPVLLSGSGGKGSVLARDRLRRDSACHAVGLVTTVTAMANLYMSSAAEPSTKMTTPAATFAAADHIRPTSTPHPTRRAASNSFVS